MTPPNVSGEKVSNASLTPISPHPTSQRPEALSYPHLHPCGPLAWRVDHPPAALLCDGGQLVRMEMRVSGGGVGRDGRRRVEGE